MIKKKFRVLNAVLPIGKMPSVDKELKKQISAIPADRQSIKNILDIVVNWEGNAIRKLRQSEEKVKSYPVGV